MTRWNRFGFELRDDANWFSFTLPYWPLAAALAGLPVLRITGFMRRRTRIKTGLCPRCGYDLTGNVSGTCSECGTAAVKT
jgi:hypothetical protein